MTFKSDRENLGRRLFLMHNNYNALIKSAKTCARNVGITFLDEYLKGPFAQELSENKKNFLDNHDFKVGLLSKLFYEFKKLGIWNEITDDDWDDMCNLTVSTAFQHFVEVING